MFRTPFRFSLALILGLIAFLGSNPGAAQIPIDQDDQLEDAGQYSPPWFAELQDVELAGNFAYVFGVGGLAIFDISNPDFPVEVGRYEPPGHPYNRYYRGAVSGGLACGGAREDRLAIIDVSVPSAPLFLSLHGTLGTSYEGAEMQGDYIYACRHDQGLEIVNIANPLVPVSDAEVTTLVNSWDVALDGSYAYVADGAGGLAVIDVSSPGQPVHLNSFPTSGSAVDVVVKGSTAVVCSGSAGIDIFDLATPTAPVLVSSINTSGLAITAAIAGNIVYVADWDDVEAFDISNPALPVPAGGEDTPVRAMGLDARLGLVAVADWSRFRLYRPGPTTLGDIQVTVESINFGNVPVGATVDTTFTIGNTGGGPVNISLIEDFGANFTVLDPGPFAIPVGGTVDVGLRFSHPVAGYDATFIKITSDDTDESSITFPVQADDSPSLLALGEVAPEFIHFDTDGARQKLSSYYGRVVVMAFFANW
ncbi:MAG: hypothetical protein ABFS42_09785 [Candidatus Krumholzibacteriota bacterium]